MTFYKWQVCKNIMDTFSAGKYSSTQSPSGFSPASIVMLPVGIVSALGLVGFLGVTYTFEVLRSEMYVAKNTLNTALPYLPTCSTIMENIQKTLEGLL